MLVAVHTVVAGQRLLELVRLLREDLRIQLVFTQAPSELGNGVTEFVAALDGLTIGWAEAVRARWDLVLASDYEAIELIDGPLLVVPHGAGYTKLAPRPSTEHRAPSTEHRAPSTEQTVHGLDRCWLTHQGLLVPSVVALSHREQLARLERGCPEAVLRAWVVGDPCHDRLAVSRAKRRAYRRAMRIRRRERLLVATSTWGPDSLFGHHPELLARLVAQAPRGLRVAALLHPHVWFQHGPGQIRWWLREPLRNGLLLVKPEAPWLGALVAADCVLADHGSVGLYATALDLPILFGHYPEHRVDPASPMAALAGLAPHLDPTWPLVPQLEHAVRSHRPGRLAAVAARITSRPGEAAAALRQVMYQLLELAEPAAPVLVDPVGLPTLVSQDSTGLPW